MSTQDKIDNCGAMLRGTEAGAQDALNQARRNPAAWFKNDYYDQFQDTTAALAFQRCYYRAYDRAQKELEDAQD